MEKSTKKTSLTKEQFIRECAEGKLRDISNEDLTEIFKQFKKDELDKVDSDLEKTTKKSKDYKKGESLLTKFGVIKKIWAHCYSVEEEKWNVDYHNFDLVEKGDYIVFSLKKDAEIETKSEECSGYILQTRYDLLLSKEMTTDEIEERYTLLDIESILEGEELKLEVDGYYFGQEEFDQTFLSIEEVRKQREDDKEAFDAKGIVKKIASENKLTPKKIDALIELLKEIK